MGFIVLLVFDDARVVCCCLLVLVLEMLVMLLLCFLLCWICCLCVCGVKRIDNGGKKSDSGDVKIWNFVLKSVIGGSLSMFIGMSSGSGDDKMLSSVCWRMCDGCGIGMWRRIDGMWRRRANNCERRRI